MKTTPVAPNPWYREPWPWLLMSGPGIVVVAGFFTFYLAASGTDGLVVDDYYKQGKTINQALHRDDVAREAGLNAFVTFDQANDRVEVVAKRGGDVTPAVVVTEPLTLSLVHATRAGFDSVIPLTRNGDRYAGQLPALRVGKWNVLLEDKQKQWRLQREINVGSEALPPIELTPPAAATPVGPLPSKTP